MTIPVRMPLKSRSVSRRTKGTNEKNEWMRRGRTCLVTHILPCAVLVIVSSSLTGLYLLEVSLSECAHRDAVCWSWSCGELYAGRMTVTSVPAVGGTPITPNLESALPSPQRWPPLGRTAILISWRSLTLPPFLYSPSANDPRL